jgi:ribosome-associated protein
MASKSGMAKAIKKPVKTTPSKTKPTSSAKTKPAKKAVVKSAGKSSASGKTGVSGKKKISNVPLKVAKAPKKGTLKAVKTLKKPATIATVKSPAERLADAAIHGILEKKGKNVICMNLKDVPNAVCDYFIICEAQSTQQVSAIADSVDFEVKKATGENPFHTEGWENSLWILLDYVNVVIHVFESETRHFYRLESLWADAEVKEYGVEYA